MTEQEVQEFVDVIAHSYPSFPRPSSMQLSLWSADLAPYGLPTAQEALRRWIRWHCGEYPQLGDVLHLIKVVEAESVRWRSTAEDVPSERTPDQSKPRHDLLYASASLRRLASLRWKNL